MDLSSTKSIMAGIPPWMLLGVGFVSGWLKSFWQFVYNHTVLVVEKRIKVSITIEDIEHKTAFNWINQWTEKQLKKKKVSHLRIQKKSWDNEDKNEVVLVPGYGFYFFWWKHKLVTFTSEKSSGGDESSVKPIVRTINLTVWGTRDRSKLLEILLEAKDEYIKANPKRISYYIHRSDYWDSHNLIERELDTIYLPERQMEQILGVFENFFSSKDKYRRLGIPWRTGMLLEGPPGTGKSSLVQALSHYFKIPIYYVNLNSSINASMLMSLLSEINEKGIVLMEDVDGITAAKDRDKEDKKNKKEEPLGIKSSELLNILDGLVATENRIIIMTSNHPDKLDPALVRAGRVDHKFHLGYAQETELRRFHERAKELYPLADYSTFRNALPENCTIADAQVEAFKSLTNQANYDIIAV